MSKKLCEYTNYLLIVIIGFTSFYLSSNSIIFSPNPTQNLPLWLSVLSASILLVFLFITLFLNIKYNKFKPNIILIGLLGSLFVFNTITIVFFKEKSLSILSADRSTTYNLHFAFSTEEKLLAILSFLGTITAIYLVFDIVYKIVDFDKFIINVCYVLLVACFVFIIIGYVKFSNRYFLLYQHLTDGQLYHASIPSIFATKNEYGLVLYVGVLSSLVLHIYKRKWYWLVCSGYLYLNIIHSLSKLIIIIGFLTIVSYFICIFFTTYKKHKKQNIVFASVFGGIIFFSFVIGLIYLTLTNKIVQVLDTFYFVKGNDTFQTRTFIWEKALTIINNSNLAFGSGHVFFAEMLHACNAIDVTAGENVARYSAHNSFLQYIGEGGIVFLIAEIIVLIYVIYLSIRVLMIKEHRDIAFLSLTTITLFLIYMFFESATIGLSISLDYALITLLTMLTIIHIANKNNLLLIK